VDGDSFAGPMGWNEVLWEWCDGSETGWGWVDMKMKFVGIGGINSVPVKNS